MRKSPAWGQQFPHTAFTAKTIKVNEDWNENKHKEFRGTYISINAWRASVFTGDVEISMSVSVWDPSWEESKPRVYAFMHASSRNADYLHVLVHSHSCLQAFIIPASRRRISFNVYVMISSFLHPDLLLANYKFSWLSIKLNVQNFQSVQRQHLKHCMYSHHPSALSLLAR